MQSSRRRFFETAGVALALAAPGLPAAAKPDDDEDDGDGLRGGHVFTMTNATSGNELLVHAVGGDGTLGLRQRLATHGAGTGGGLGNQGAVTFSRSGRFLFVVNALSHTVSTFAVRRRSIVLRSVVDAGGLQPISVTEHDGLVVVLNAEGAGGISAFRNLAGRLHPLPGGTRPLSAAGGTGPAQVGFSPDGDVLLVTEKATDKLTSYRVRHHGLVIGQPLVTASAGATPFGFAFDKRGTAIVSEAFGGAANASAVSSYVFDDWQPARPILRSASVGTTQTAACWVVVTPNGRFAYVTNTGSGTISSYAVLRSGQVRLLAAVAAVSPGGPIDAAISADGRWLFALNAGAGTLTSFAIAADGGLAAAGTLGGLVAGTNGLAAN
ncbi:MAG: beta-propeller fold lactonase family protein [Rubrivivax sp.]|nr:beta-propeller fold lactonase family protein [Rubrivivax sp.]